MKLNDQQETARADRSQHKRITAGPGTGKTALSVQLLADAHAQGKQIIACSFTLKSTDELARRFANAIGITQTFHKGPKRWCRTISEATGHQFNTLDGIIHKAAIQHNIINTNYKMRWTKRHPKTGIIIDHNQQILGNRTLDETEQRIANKLIDQMQKLDPALDLSLSRWMDHVITEKLKIKKQRVAPYEWLRWKVSQINTPARKNAFIMIDEAQDLAPVQWEALWAVVGDPETAEIETAIIGDEAQAIYQFQGAQGILPNFTNSQTHTLTTTYRTDSEEIIDAIYEAGQQLPEQPPRLETPKGTVMNVKRTVTHWTGRDSADICLSYKNRQSDDLRGKAEHMTIHKAKGLEFDAVLYDQEGINDSDCPANLNYVAVSRARQRLITYKRA